MIIRGCLIFALIMTLTSCQTGLIPCPTVKAPKYKKSTARKAFYEPKMASAKASVPEKRYTRPEGKIPPLQHVNVEEWDCPKPGTKRALPKAVRDNIKRNKKAYEHYYRNRSYPDSTNVGR